MTRKRNGKPDPGKLTLREAFEAYYPKDELAKRSIEKVRWSSSFVYSRSMASSVGHPARAQFQQRSQTRRCFQREEKARDFAARMKRGWTFCSLDRVLPASLQFLFGQRAGRFGQAEDRLDYAAARSARLAR